MDASSKSPYRLTPAELRALALRLCGGVAHAVGYIATRSWLTHLL